jgi:NADH-quinone oxidoreductase subunit C
MTSSVLTSNHYVVQIEQKFLNAFSKIIKREMNSALSFLVEQSAVDAANYKTDCELLKMSKKENPNTKLYFNMFYSYANKTRITVFVNTDSEGAIVSLQNTFENANWLERETSEMLELFFKKKPDIRNLMLDYPKIEFPMLKEFPVEGHQDIYYNVFEDAVQYVRNEYVEI